MKMEELRDSEIYCNNFEDGTVKDRSWRVVMCFWFRRVVNSTRLGVRVATAVLSCLGSIAGLGIIVGGFGTKNCGKGVNMVENGQYWSSKGIGP